MIILVLNCGSSSIKYELVKMESQKNKKVLATGIAERIGLPEGTLVHKPKGKDKFILNKPFPTHTDGIADIFKCLVDGTHGVISSIDEIEAVGHRIVHGGEFFSESVLVTPEVIARIEECSELAPLHNPAHLQGIHAVLKAMPTIPQVVVFDTSYHQTMPEKAFYYGLPYDFYKKYKIRRYGFHGTSHQFVAHKAAEMAGIDINNSKIITCHMGNGASIAAIHNGKSVDTSMGFTPLEGLMMGTRTGDLDVGAVTFLQEKEGWNADQINDLVNKKSGLMGISGVSSDMRDLWQAKEDGNERATLALDMFIYRVAKYVGAFIAAMNGVDMVVFTGGIGENDWEVRQVVAEHLGYMGAEMNIELNYNQREDNILSTPNSKIKLVLAKTDEEQVIARDTMNIVKKLKK